MLNVSISKSKILFRKLNLCIAPQKKEVKRDQVFVGII